MTTPTFTCDACKNVFPDVAGEYEEALAEKARDFPKVPLEKCGRVCHDCYMKYVGRHKN